MIGQKAVVMRILVTSASGANGNGYGAILGFGPEGEFTGPFSSDPRIADPRGISLDDTAIPAGLDEEGEFLLSEGIVPFPRGFGFGHNGLLYLASGVAPCGQGDNTIVVFDRSGTLLTPRLVTDPELSPLDLKLAPNGNIVVASEWLFRAPDAVTSVRVLVPEGSVGFRRPRGLRFGPGDRLYCRPNRGPRTPYRPARPPAARYEAQSLRRARSSPWPGRDRARAAPASAGPSSVPLWNV